MQIKSMKHHGGTHRIWHENKILHKDETEIIGMNNCTSVSESDGRVWKTSGLAIFYFSEDQWFNIIIMFDEAGKYSFYCNIASPYSIDKNVLSYIDYDIDVIVQQDFTYKIVDIDEYEKHESLWGYTHKIKQQISKAINVLLQMIETKQAPFNEQFVYYWYDRAIDVMKK